MSREPNHHQDILQRANSSGTSHRLTLSRLDWPAKSIAFTDDQIVSGREIVCFAEALFTTWLGGFNSRKVDDDLLQLSPYYGLTEWEGACSHFPLTEGIRKPPKSRQAALVTARQGYLSSGGLA